MFTCLFEQTEISKFNPTELKPYEDSVNAYRDIVNAIKTAEKKKYANGRAETLVEVTKHLLKMDMPIEKIMRITELAEDDIRHL